MAGLWLGMALSVIDSAAINIALPAMAADFATPAAGTTLVVSIYQAAIVALLLPMAALGERLGYQRVYLGGALLFTAASLFCALSTSLAALASFRLLQGLGSAAMMAVNGAQMRFCWPRAQFGRGIGWNGLVIAGSAMLGPPFAAFVLTFGSWPLLFLVNLPLGLVVLLLVGRWGPDSPRSASPFDGGSALFSALFFGLLFVAATGPSGWPAAGLLLGAAAAGLLLLRRASNRPRPMLPIDLMARPILRRAYLGSILAFASQMLLLVSLPFMLQARLSFAAAAIGLAILPLPVGVALASPLAGRLADSRWSATASTLGLLLLATALATLALAPAGPAFPLLHLAMLAAGFGFGLFQVPNNHVLLNTAPRARAGAASGMLSLCRLAGQTTGAVLAGIVLGRAGADSGAGLLLAAGFALAAAAIVSGRREQG